MRVLKTRPWLAFIIGGMLAALVLGGVSLATDPDAEQGERARQVGAARVSASSDKVVAEVNGHAITSADFAETVRVVETNLDYMRGEIANGSFGAEDMKVRIQLIEEAGVHSAALSGLIGDRASYDRAIKEGFAATEEEVQAKVAEGRRLVDEGEVTGLPEYAQAVGEERYWTELLPVVLRRQLAIAKMRTQHLKNVAPENYRREWTSFQAQAIESAEIQLLDPDAVAPATVQGALDYVDTLLRWELR